MGETGTALSSIYYDNDDNDRIRGTNIQKRMQLRRYEVVENIGGRIVKRMRVSCIQEDAAYAQIQ